MTLGVSEVGMFTLYDFAPSGNCYKLRLTLAVLGIEYERVPIDILQGGSRTEQFLKINPNGRVPVLQTPEGDYLPESNAALWFLASGTSLCPLSRLQQAQTLQWMFFEQYSHEPFIATSRYWVSILDASEKYRRELKEKRVKGYEALNVMEQHLRQNAYFVSGECSIADIALYAYTHVAHEGGFELDNYPAIQAWFGRVEQLPNFVSITA